MRERFGYNSTIARKQKQCRSCGKSCYPFSKGRCQPCATREDTMKRVETANESIIIEEGLSEIIKEADRIFSEYIRLKYADENGNVKCFTCENIKHWTLMQNGHYIKRGCLFLRLDERNCRPQDAECNEFNDGNIPVFANNLENERPGITDILMEESLLVHKPSRFEIRNIITEYKQKVKTLKSKLA